MPGDDFSTWYSAGAYGGLVCALAAAAVIAAIALRGRRGTPRQAASAVLACLAAAGLMLLAVWWDLNRLDVYGPLLGGDEVMFWLTWAAAAGWVAPLASLAAFWSLAGAPALAAGPVGPLGRLGPAGTAGPRASPMPRVSNVQLASLDDPARQVEPRGPGRAWGQLVALNEPFAGRASPLTRQLTFLGRETNNDIVLGDERSSRFHAEIHWDHGHVQIVDRGSTNGTLLNRQPVFSAMPLVPGDVIEMGDQRYRFELVEGIRIAAPAPPPPGSETQRIPGVPTVSLAFEGVPLMLIALNGATAGERRLLRAGITEIGRDAERAVCLPDLSVSRLHAQVVRQRTGYYVQDLQSRNGTWLNGQPLGAPAVLSAGDVLRVGEIELRCEAVTMPIPTAPPPAHPTQSAQPGSRSAVTTPPAGVWQAQAGVFSNTGAPVSRSAARLGPPRLSPSDPPASPGSPAPGHPPRQ